MEKLEDVHVQFKVEYTNLASNISTALEKFHFISNSATLKKTAQRCLQI